jgi:hypothetical protein
MPCRLSGRRRKKTLVSHSAVSRSDSALLQCRSPGLREIAIDAGALRAEQDPGDTFSVGQARAVVPVRAVVSSTLAPRFPLLSRGTHLVLADASGDDLLAFWHLSADHLIPAVAGFARDGARPVPVLRLRRIHGSDAEIVREIPLRLTGAGGRGEQLFSVGPRPARYDAELGLSDAAGGWVMLARSNALDHAARLEVRLAPIEHPSAGSRSAADGEPAHQDAEPKVAVANRPASVPGVRPAGPDPSPDVGVPAGDAPVTSPDTKEPQGLRRLSVEPEEQPSADTGSSGAAGQAPRSPPELDSSPLDRRGLDSSHPNGGGAQGLDRFAAGRSTGSPTEPMVYGRLAPRSGKLMIEAELRINGCAEPGSEIDLFGRPYRVGPGGRFQLVIRVDDPALIKRAFELNPPNLPDRPTEDDSTV